MFYVCDNVKYIINFSKIECHVVGTNKSKFQKVF